MATKNDIEERMNKKLDMEIEWSQLKKDDLEKLEEGLEDEDFVKKFVGAYANEKAGELAQDQVLNWEPGQMVRMFAQFSGSEVDITDL